MSAEKVEMEQVPLKSDTDTPVEEETNAEATTDVDAEAQKPTEPKKKWFHFGKSGAKKAEPEAAEAEPEAEPETKEVVDSPKKEQKKWWQRANCASKPKKEVAEGEAELQFGLDMVHRDEHNINEYVSIAFEDVFGEPDGVHSFDCVWRLTNKVFSTTRLFFYRLFSLLVALPAAIVFALLFAVVHAFSVFCCTPAGRLLAVPALWIAKTWSFLIHAIFDPIFKSVSLCCGKKNFGFSSAPTSDNIA
uniref:Caveolin n=1 Tax=Steinernema glaseri TaxID=37863 RepID=A0A1I7ZPU3_9BILA